MFKFHQERLQDNEENMLGSGFSGQVFPYQKDSQDMRWVVKKILAKTIKEFLGCLPEIVLGFSCDHPCVVSVQSYFVEHIPALRYFHVYLKMPRMKESLARHLKNRKISKIPFTEKEIIRHFYSLTCGLKYLHHKRIYHRDIRHDNLLLDDHGNLKIADVGIAKHVEEEDAYHTITGQIGTYNYSAPEILGAKAKKDLLHKADVWSLGVVIFELCAFELRLVDSQLPQDKLQSCLNQLFGHLEKEGKYQKKLIAFLKRILSIDPEQRPSLEQIKDELEKNFRESLDLINFENSRPLQMGKKV